MTLAEATKRCYDLASKSTSSGLSWYVAPFNKEYNIVTQSQYDRHPEYWKDKIILKLDYETVFNKRLHMGTNKFTEL
jgi:hypothetical protein